MIKIIKVNLLLSMNKKGKILKVSIHLKIVEVLKIIIIVIVI